MMRRYYLAACGLAALLCGWSLAISQEAKQPAKTSVPPTAKPASKEDPAAKPGSKTEKAEVPAPPTASRGAFDKQMEEWKVILKKMRELRSNFQTAKEEEQKKLSEEFKVEVEKGKLLLPKLRDTALAAYLETGSADPQLERFLLKFVTDSVEQDDFEPGLALAKKMLDGGSTDKQLPGLAAICAFSTNDYVAAEAFFKSAAESGIFASADSEIAKLGTMMMSQVAKEKELWEKELVIRKAEEAKDDLPRVKLTTNKGVMVIELFENEAPDTVGNFISLVEKKFYDGLSFHRVLSHFMAQGGDPKGDGTGGPGYQIYCECHKPEYRRHFRGSLSMAHAGRDTGGSQFFLTFRQTPELDGRHTCFGRVIEGMDVLAKIQRKDPEMTEASVVPDKIITAEVVRKRDHAYAPKKVEQ
ncbi:MAG: peptidylprolyl isomerase [Planctomycetales bacterium]|nr:peptidylprolyl isomerase [Planctomycetales bacterium]